MLSTWVAFKLLSNDIIPSLGLSGKLPANRWAWGPVCSPKPQLSCLVNHLGWAGLLRSEINKSFGKFVLLANPSSSFGFTSLPHGWLYSTLSSLVTMSGLLSLCTHTHNHTAEERLSDISRQIEQLRTLHPY